MQKLFITTSNQSSIDFNCQLHYKHNQITKGKDKKKLKGCKYVYMYMYIYVPAWNKKRKQIIVYNIIDIKQCVECDKEKEEILRLEL